MAISTQTILSRDLAIDHRPSCITTSNTTSRSRNPLSFTTLNSFSNSNMPKRAVPTCLVVRTASSASPTSHEARVRQATPTLEEQETAVVGKVRGQEDPLADPDRVSVLTGDAIVVLLSPRQARLQALMTPCCEHVNGQGSA